MPPTGAVSSMLRAPPWRPKDCSIQVPPDSRKIGAVLPLYNQHRNLIDINGSSQEEALLSDAISLSSMALINAIVGRGQT